MASPAWTVGIYTLGCKVNQYESEAIAEQCARYGFKVLSPRSVCDVYIINTCTVTAEADRKSRQYIGKAKRRNPDAYVIVTGCYAQLRPEQILATGLVDRVCGNTAKLDAARAALELVQSGKHGIPSAKVEDIRNAPFEDMRINAFGRTRVCVKIEDGCESRCAYCTIPLARGKIRSKKPSDAIFEAEELVKQGCGEIVLTGIEISNYGKDLGNTDLISLLREMDKIPGMKTVRLGSLEPSSMTDDFIDSIADIRCAAPHFHISVQSGCDRTLHAMRRKYGVSDLTRIAERLREKIPGVTLTCDLIAGFPGETEEDFAKTMEFVEKTRFLSVHVFPFSRRPDTPAFSMPDQITKAEKAARARRLGERSREIRAEILAEYVRDNPVTEILAEYSDGEFVFGHTRSFIPVAVKTDSKKKFIKVRLESSDGEICRGVRDDSVKSR